MTQHRAAEASLRIVIVDDEPLALRAMVDALGNAPGDAAEFEIVAQCSDGAEAIEAVRETRPDLLVLDVQMPEIDGFEVLRRLAPGEIPAVVFVTAYDDYAVAAFEQQAVDYVLKPFTEVRLRRAVERARSRIRGDGLSALGEQVLSLLGDRPGGAETVPTPPFLERLAIPKRDRTLVVEVGDIDWLEAADYYVRVHVGEQHHLVRKSLKWFDNGLDPKRFIRVHRSAIINVGRLCEMRRLGRGDHVAVMPHGRFVPLSRAGREALNRVLG